MAIPDYQTVMLPLLEYSADEQEHSLRDAIDILADKFGLTEEERKELLPSGQQEVFINRVGWARTYMKKAGLLEITRRGYFRITPRGLQVLAKNPTRIDVKFLDQFDEFKQFRAIRHEHQGGTPAETVEVETTPEEALEAAYKRLRDSLASDLLQQSQNMFTGPFRENSSRITGQNGIWRQQAGCRPSGWQKW